MDYSNDENVTINNGVYIDNGALMERRMEGDREICASLGDDDLIDKDGWKVVRLDRVNVFDRSRGRTVHIEYVAHFANGTTMGIGKPKDKYVFCGLPPISRCFAP
jgi:hypothetical protein